MRVLSLFDGMSCGQIALNRIGLKPAKYYAAEIDKYAVQVTQANYPNTIQMGDVTKWREWCIDWASIDLLIGGSPCQGFSFAGKQLAFDDPRSKLFFVYVDILNHIKSLNPNVKFMLENVKMKKEHLAIISEQLGVEPVFINSNLVSAQNRQRYYWCNWYVEQPEDKGILLADILEHDPDEAFNVKTQKHIDYINRRLDKKYTAISPEKVLTLLTRDYTNWNGTYVKTYKSGKPKVTQDKAGCLTAGAHSGGNHSDMDILVTPLAIRRLTPIECERLQTAPDNYTNHVSNTQRYKMLGNGWTVDVIAHIFSQMELPVSIFARQLDMFGEAA
jgi:DNA-cytosine methyltransferase